MNFLFIHIYVGTKEINVIAMKKFRKACVKTLEIHWVANNVGVFGNTGKFGKIRFWLKDNDVFWVLWTY
jgi:hypothetical protein